MEIFYINERPAALPAAVAPLSAVRVAVAATRPSAPQVHQVEAQAELILATVPNGVQGTSGFTGMGIDGAKKRTDVRGVPPRGRPV
ncbi:hypothetical protein GA0070609_0232 [Micromonospora echinaurantiaca]|uniref:Uncharacterized protein n=1 Tax=Micromonospora echinaurantiaca TaxID=47857 RepID=A0A1C5GR80_9ACTN|nr:hypothetical protein [Micromonospora echinaurantiaca]SCG36292.1 hypothetical protein GA0070609_0232 [Micromonospora echinaurantiaca]